MRRKTLQSSKLTLSIFVAIFALSFISLSGSNGFLKPNEAVAADPAIGPAIDNPGIRKAMDVQGRHSERIMGIPGVVGHGIGISSEGEPVIKIFVERAGIPGIPSALERVPTKVEVTGMFVAYADPTARFPRPVPIGVSTGHPDITAGTIGCRVTDGTNVYALSNNHIYANGNDATGHVDNALQPGPYDGGQDPADAIGVLYDFEPIDFSGGNNEIDAAIAISSPSQLGTSTPSGDGYGTPNSSIFGDLDYDGFFDDKTSLLDLQVQKYGRTTGWTQGQVAEINLTVDVCYETRGPFRCVKLARFVDQIGITDGTFSDGGDSGSLIVTSDGTNNPVGLLFAGSNTRTLANRIDLVLNRFNVVVDDSETPDSGNYPPIADFSFTTTEHTADFTDASTDSDGTCVAWDWDFGDGNTSATQNPSHTYAAGGTYTVSLTVTDNEGATDTVSSDVTVSSGGSGEITLTATGYKVKGRQKADLEWSDATSTDVDIYRDGSMIATTANDGFYTDNINQRGGGSYTYKVCEEGTSTCSNEATVIF
jgi:PKD repeat protein